MVQMTFWLTSGFNCFLSKLVFLAVLLLSACVADQKERDEFNQSKEDIIEHSTAKDQQTAFAKPSNRAIEITGTGSKLNSKDAEDLVASLGFAAIDNSSILAVEDTKPTVHEKPKEMQSYQANCSVFDTGRDRLPHQRERINFCKKISNRLASVSMDSCMASKLELSGCESVGGVPLMLREFPPIKDKEPIGRVLVIGGTHGDELTSVSITFRWIETLNKHHSGLFHWHVVPAMNPDGLLKRGATRTNKNGIDLNRNLPSEDWTKNALKYWKTKGGSNPRKYPGLTPNSEPETQWLVDEIHQFRPDAIISIHAPYGVVDFDAQRLNTAPKSLGKLRLNLLGTYPGSLGNYAGINLNIPVITLELPHAWEMPSRKESQLIWEDIVQWLKINLPKRKKALAAKK